MPVLLLSFLPHIAVLLCAAAIVGGAYFKGRSAGYDAAEQHYRRAAEEAAERFSQELARQQALLEKTDSELSAARREARRERDELDDVLSSDPGATAWGAVPLPDGVREALRSAGVPDHPGHPD